MSLRVVGGFLFALPGGERGDASSLLTVAAVGLGKFTDFAGASGHDGERCLMNMGEVAGPVSEWSTLVPEVRSGGGRLARRGVRRWWRG